MENIILGHEPTKGPSLDFKKAREQIVNLSKQYGLDIDPDAKISDITVAQQQRVEIMKVLYRGADILIFDEPTAVLTPQEIVEFIKIMKNLAKEGKSIILITHKLKEIKESADRVTVIRAGKSIQTVDVADADDEQLAEMMVGHHVNFKLDKPDIDLGKEVLQVKDLHVKEDRGTEAVKGLSFTIHGGEVLGLAGIDGNGQDELVEAITGLRHVESGSVMINGQDLTNKPVREITESGVAHIPADRQSTADLKPAAVRKHGSADLLQAALLQARHHERKGHPGTCRELIKKFDVRTTSEQLPASDLSGGN